MASPAARGRDAKQARIRAELVHRISRMSPGQPLPPERALAAEFDVARQTIRAAVDSLVAEGLLYRRHGSGTFVTEPARKLTIGLTLMSFTEDMVRRGMRPGSRVLSLRPGPAGPVIGARLRVSPREEVWSIRRLRLADAEPMAIETLHLPRAVLPKLTKAQLDRGSFYGLLAQAGIEIDHATQTIEATVLDADEGAALKVPEHSPAFLFERTTYDDSGRVVEYVKSVYRSDRYRLLTELRPGAGTTRSHRLEEDT